MWSEAILKIQIANTLTLIRIAMIPLVVIGFYLPYSWGRAAACMLFITAAITDSLDGYLARRLNQTSALGAFLDPVADKLMVAIALVLLVSDEPALLRPYSFSPHMLISVTACIIVGREIAISALREWMAEIGARTKIAVSGLGKLKTIFQMTGLSLMLYSDDFMGVPIFEIGLLSLIVAAVLTLWSMSVYIKAALPDLMRS